MPKRQLIGIVVSDKMQKTVVVEVERFKQHQKYLRRFRVHKRYKAHDEKNEYKVGDKVIIEEAAPLSREKRWRVIGKRESTKKKSDYDSTENKT
ncbi:MAG: 30S ribosomal protein S17 [Patescibacteria group bacterium]